MYIFSGHLRYKGWGGKLRHYVYFTCFSLCPWIHQVNSHKSSLKLLGETLSYTFETVLIHSITHVNISYGGASLLLSTVTMCVIV